MRRHAYELWEEAGRPEGRGDEFWHEAWENVALSGEKSASSATAAPAPAVKLPTNDQRSKPTT